MCDSYLGYVARGMADTAPGTDPQHPKASNAGHPLPVIMASSRPRGLAAAFDEARFGPARTLDLRTDLPTVTEALRRTEPWLRERQMAKAGEVLVITGRGLGSPEGIGAIRAAVGPLLARLKRTGVVERVVEHNAGAFAVTLAPIRALFETGARSRGPRPTPPAPAMSSTLATLDTGTAHELRLLARYSLEQLGVRPNDRLIEDEMLRQFSILAHSIAPDETDRMARLSFLVAAARQAYEEA